ncbi:zinc finger BED domain-containing protein RICESLEEPER 2 [Tanacetum coccineum]
MAHILNLIVQVGLKTYQKQVDTIALAVKYIKHSSQRVTNFKESVEYATDSKKFLVSECPTRWNSTHDMLKTAIELKDAFLDYDFKNSSFARDLEETPKRADFEVCRKVVQFLEKFKGTPKLVSNVSSPVAHLWFGEVLDIDKHLREWQANATFKDMIVDMRKKYDKYWGDYKKINHYMYFAVILDPTMKSEIIGYGFKHLIENGCMPMEQDEEDSQETAFDFLTPDELCKKFVQKVEKDMGSLSYALSWKPCQGDSLNLPDHRYSIYTIKRETGGLDDGVAASFQRSRIHKPHAHTQAFKEVIKHEEPEEDDEDLEEDPVDYPADRDDDDDDDEDEDEDEEEEEEHPAPTDSVPPVHRMTARISIRDEPSISLPPREEVERLLTLTTPPPSPLTPLSSPLPHIPSPPFPTSPPASPIRPLGYRAAMIWLRAETPSTSHLLTLPTSSPLLQLLSSDHRTDRPKITLPPRKRLGIDLGPRYEIRESLAVAATRPVGGRRADYGFVGTMDTEIRRRRAEEVGYGIRDVWVDPREAVEEVAPMTFGGVNTRVTKLTAVQEQDTQDIYAVIEDTQDRQTQIYHRVGTLVDDSQYHYETGRLLDQEALQAVISQLQAADRKSQVVTLEMLQADYRRQVQLNKALELLKGLHTQMAELQRQLGP